MPQRNAGLSPERRIEFRIGVHLGDIVEEADGDLMGDGVNIAARLEGICEPNCVCLSGAAYDQIRDKLDYHVVDLGERELKNIRRPVRAYQIGMSPTAVALGAAAPNRAASSPPLTDRTSLAVLPFQNLGGDPETDYFADGVIEDVITALSRLPVALRDRSELILRLQGKVDRRPSDRARTRRPIPSRGLNPQGGKAGADFGAVHRGRCEPAYLGRLFQGDLAEIFELQDRITIGVIVAAEPSLPLAEIERAQRKPTDNLDAYDLYLRALPYINAYTREGFTEAEGLLRRAIALDCAYPYALAALAECLVRMTLNGWVSDKAASTEEACDLAGRAVRADPENAAVLAVAAWAYSTLGVHFEQSLELANRALALHPNSVHVRSFCGWVFNYFGESLRAIEQFEEARRLSPVDPKGYFPMLGLAAAHFFAGHFEETVNITGRILAEVPTHNVARRYRAAALGHLGRIDEANVVIADLLAAQPNSSLRSARSSGFRNAGMSALYVTGLELAGLPE